jgi:putative OPT family oligopeptide transporter
MWLLPQVPVSFFGAVLIVFFSFFFVTVSSRIVGLIGSSSNPVSGMTIATLLGTSLIFVALGWTGEEHMVMALSIGAVVCISAAIAGDTSQDLKSGYLVGATPRKQQLGEFIGVLTSALVMGWIILFLDSAYQIGSEQLPAPQATLMSLVVRGVLTAELPWGLVMIGIFLAATLELLGINSLPCAVGIYLPISLSTPIMVGGFIRYLVDKNVDKASKEGIERGTLFSSGLIAGGALMGIIIAGLVVYKNGILAEAIQVGNEWMGSLGRIISLLIFFLLAFLLFRIVRKAE